MAVGEFDAFISYSRRASSTLAVDLQAAVERFAKPWYALRAVRVFRDDASMSANVALWSTIEQALTQAEWFVLLASPQAAASAYVAKEVEWWRAHKGADRILLVLEEGADIAWDPVANDFDWDRTDSLPRSMAGAFAEEPRWIDLRWFEQEGSLGRADPRWPERVADVAAAVRFAERDQLVGENVREHRKLRRLRRGAVMALALLLVASLVATVVAVLQQREAERQTEVAVEQRREATAQARIALARQLSAQAISLAPTDLQTASLLAVQGYRTHEDPQTRAALFQLASSSPKLVRPLAMGAEVTASAATADGIAVTGDADGDVVRWDGADPVPLGTVGGRVSDLALSEDGSVVAAAAPDGVTVWRDGVVLTLTDMAAPLAVAVDPTGTLVAASDDSLLASALWDLSGGEPRLRGTVEVGGSELAFGGDSLAVLYASGRWSLVGLNPFVVAAEGTHPTTQTSRVALSADATAMAASATLVDYPVWRDDAAYSDGTAANAVARTGFVGGQGLALSSDGRLLAAQTSGILQVVRVQAPEHAAERPLDLGGTGAVSNPNSEALSFGGSRYLVSAAGESAFLWDLRQFSRFGAEAIPSSLPGRCEACLPNIEVSPAGDRVAVSSLDGATSIVDVATGTSIPALDLVQGVTWLDDQGLAAWSSTRSTLVEVDATSGEVTDLATHPLADQDFVVAARGNRERVTTLTIMGVVNTFDLEDRAAAPATVATLADRLSDTEDVVGWGIAPDQSSAFVVVTGVDDVGATQRVDRLDLATGEIDFTDESAVAAAYDSRSRLRVFDGRNAGVVDERGELGDPIPAEVDEYPAPVLSSSGGLVATGGLGGLVTIVDLERQGATFGTFPVPQTDNRFALSAFTSDDSALVTVVEPMPEAGYPDGAVRRVSLVAADWIAAACAVAGRDLTADDWARYGVGPAPDDLRCLR